MKIAGIYKITNNITGDFYIGSSNDVKRRWVVHKSPSQWKRRPGMKLYQAFIKYGLDNFIFEVIEETDNLRNREQYYIEHLKPVYNDRHADGYNIERRKETSKLWHKEYYKIHRDENLSKMKDYCRRLCLYEGKTLTLSALSYKFRRQGIPHPTLEAKKYLK